MNLQIPAEEQLTLTTQVETDALEIDELAQRFTAEEIPALFWLWQQCQTGVSDCMEIVHHWELPGHLRGIVL